MVTDHQVVGNDPIMFDIYLNELSYKSLDEINQLKDYEECFLIYFIKI